MNEQTDIEISFKPIGRQGKTNITVRFPDGSTYTDKLDVTSAGSRAQFMTRLGEGRGGLDLVPIEAELQQIASGVVNMASADDDASQADQLVELASDAHLFHTPGGHDSDGFAAIECDDHREVWPINSRAFRRYLARKFHESEGKVPGGQALQDALNVIAGKAIYDGPEHEVGVRIAWVRGVIYLDLADAQWQVVEVTKDGWRVISGREAPAWFVRKPGMLPLPEPVNGGSVEELRPLLNLPDERSWVLLVACMLVYLRARGPYPILIINGEQGSAKSTLCRLVLLLIDPRKAGLRRPPREERDLMIAASNSLVVGFDNLSSLLDWISDALCSLATGGGFSTRALYTDDDEKIFDAMRPVLLNGIDSVANRSDLLDRAVHLHLPTIPEEKRMPETNLWMAFEGVRARVLGALLDAVVVALRNEDTVKLPSYPRMADFAIWTTAAEEALGWSPGTFMAAYAGNRQEAHELAIESSPIGPPILSFMHKRVAWEGSAKELRENLEDHADEKTTKRRDWPKSPNAMRGWLHRIAQDLRAIGLAVEFLPRTGRVRPIRLEWASGRAPGACDTPGPDSDSQGEGDRHSKNLAGGPGNARCDSRDGHDGPRRTHSGDTGDEPGEVVKWSG